jgi:hypothetical protein
MGFEALWHVACALRAPLLDLAPHHCPATAAILNFVAPSSRASIQSMYLRFSHMRLMRCNANGQTTQTCDQKYCHIFFSFNRSQLLLPPLLLLLLIFGLARQLPWVMPTNRMHRAFIMP